jgi:hypothetical protein
MRQYKRIEYELRSLGNTLHKRALLHRAAGQGEWLGSARTALRSSTVSIEMAPARCATGATAPANDREAVWKERAMACERATNEIMRGTAAHH